MFTTYPHRGVSCYKLKMVNKNMAQTQDIRQREIIQNKSASVIFVPEASSHFDTST